MINNLQKGFAMPVLITIIALAVVILGGISYFVAREKSPVKEDVIVKLKDNMIEKDDAVTNKQEDNTMEKDGEMMKKEEAAIMEKKDGEMMPEESMIKYSGVLLAGKSSPLLDFNKADYDVAIKSDKLVVLYFYANWCPICKAEFPVTQGAFNELTTNKVIGFRVNYNDGQTDADEKALAKQFGVAYQHTKVFVKNGQRILKSPETWDDKRYNTEINKALP